MGKEMSALVGGLRSEDGGFDPYENYWMRNSQIVEMTLVLKSEEIA
jgi:hypothetical protein